ncbi:MAG: PIN domain-containing protein [Chloroflexi bacterium]|nr:PIN domain-containing protein [Chloroflexota bacterium]MBI3170697.1 PIN domain-containing protein [Chloroflexota bacterium]
MKIYLDICAIQRPLDSYSQIRIALEAEAVLGILALCDEGKLELVSSDILIYETEQNPLPIRQEHGFAVLAKAKTTITLTESAKTRSAELVRFGLKPIDALHVALAESIKVDYFCTCDDRLIKASKRINDLQVKIVSPLELIQEIENDHGN